MLEERKLNCQGPVSTLEGVAFDANKFLIGQLHLSGLWQGL